MSIVRQLLITAVLTGGCALTPEELRQLQPSVTFDTALAPLSAAQCLGQSAEAFPKLLAADQFAAVWREGPERHYEVLVRRTASVPLLIAEVSPRDAGSTVVIRQSDTLASIDPDLAPQMARQCKPSNLVIR